MSVIKVVELVGQSKSSWEDAVNSALKEAAKTIRHLSGVKVINWTGNLNSRGEIVEYKANIQVAFRVESESQ